MDTVSKHNHACMHTYTKQTHTRTHSLFLFLDNLPKITIISSSLSLLIILFDLNC